MLLVFLFLALVVIVEDRPIVLALRTVRETLARAALHDHADDQAQHQADADQASDTFRRLEKKMVQLGNIHVGLVASSEVACCGSLSQPHKHNVNQYTAHASREDSTFGEGLGSEQPLVGVLVENLSYKAVQYTEQNISKFVQYIERMVIAMSDSPWMVI